MTTYSTSLPSMHLTGENLTDLEQVLRKDSTNERFTFSFTNDGFEYNLNSTQNFIQQADLPDISKEYSITMRCEEGEVRIEGKKLYSGGRLRISGDKDWVHKKERQIKNEINKHKNVVRTHSTKIIGAVYAVEIFGLLVLSTTVSEGESTLSLFEGVITAGVLVGLIGWPYVLIGLIQFIHPYHLIKTNKSIQYRPRMKKLSRYIFFILTVIGGIGGVIALFRFLK